VLEERYPNAVAGRRGPPHPLLAGRCV